MIDFSVPVLIGLEKTAGGIDVTKVVGEFTRWYEILALSGIIFAILVYLWKLIFQVFVCRMVFPQNSIGCHRGIRLNAMGTDKLQEGEFFFG